MEDYIEKVFYQVFIVLLLFCMSFINISLAEEVPVEASFKIEGKVHLPDNADHQWVAATKILVDGGAFIGFLRSDGSFTIHNVPHGSYMLEVANYRYMFEPQRVDISSKGKIRSRRLNNIEPKAVQTLAYPLRFRSRGLASYFQQREQWRITDFLMNPMVLMMVLPLLLIMVMPKLMNAQDPEMQKEMQNMMPFNNKNQMPEMSEILTNMLGGGSKKATSKSKIAKRK